jgi:hypothetical protein
MNEEPKEIVHYQSDHDILIRLDERTRNMDKKVDQLTNDHESRLRSLERARWIVGGAASVVGIIGGYVIQFFT